MKFKLEELKKNTERCKEKLASEIESNYKYKSLHEPKLIKEHCYIKANEIIDSFMNNTFKSNKVTNFEPIQFGITYCEENNFDTVWLEQLSDSTYWRAENSKEVEETK